MPRYEIETLIHINVFLVVEADDEDAAYAAAEQQARTETEGRGFDPDDIVLVEGNRIVSETP